MLENFRANVLKWVVFVVALALLRGFSRGSSVSFPHENQRSKFQFDQDRVPAWKLAKTGVGFSLIIVIYFNLFIYLFTGTKQNDAKNSVVSNLTPFLIVAS